MRGRRRRLLRSGCSARCRSRTWALIVMLVSAGCMVTSGRALMHCTIAKDFDQTMTSTPVNELSKRSNFRRANACFARLQRPVDAVPRKPEAIGRAGQLDADPALDQRSQAFGDG